MAAFGSHSHVGTPLLLKGACRLREPRMLGHGGLPFRLCVALDRAASFDDRLKRWRFTRRWCADEGEPVPPSPAEWRDMENTHLAWLRIAHVIANVPSDDCVTELASMPDRATFAKGLAAAASFFHEVAELASAAEIQFLDACVEVGR